MGAIAGGLVVFYLTGKVFELLGRGFLQDTVQWFG